mgnify:CR=1 FL=1
MNLQNITNTELLVKLTEEIEKLKNDQNFAKSPRAQLNFIFKKSPYYEKAHLLIPIFKVY